MYYLRYFKTQAEAIGQTANIPTVAMVEGVDKVEFFDGDTSKYYMFAADGDFLKLKEMLVCIFDCGGSDFPYSLIYKYSDLSNIVSMEIDGVDVTIADSYNFSKKGKHVIKYALKDSVTSLTYQRYNSYYTTVAFKDVEMTSVIIPNSITEIGSEAFSYCTKLTSITIPDSVTSIGTSAFENCIALTSITIPDSVTEIDTDAFATCTSLASVTIGNSVANIYMRAFAYCNQLTSIKYTGTMAQFKSISRVDYWHLEVPTTTVTCSDGTCGLDET